MAAQDTIESLKIQLSADLNPIKALNTEINNTLKGLTTLDFQGKENTKTYANFEQRLRSLYTLKKQVTETTTRLGKEQFNLGNTTKGLNAANLSLVASFVGIGFGFQQVIRLARESIQAFAEEEKSVRVLEFSITKVAGGNKELVASLEDYAGATQKRVALDDDVIRQQEAFLVLQGRNEEQIKQIINAAIDLSAVQGDLSNENVIDNIKKLDGTYEGVVGKLSRYDDRLKNLTKTQLENGDAIKILGDKYKGTADEINKGTEGNLRILKIWGHDALELIGEFIIKWGGIVQVFLTLKKEIQPTVDLMDRLFSSMEKTVKTIPVLSDAVNTLGSAFSFLADIIKTEIDGAVKFFIIAINQALQEARALLSLLNLLPGNKANLGFAKEGTNLNFGQNLKDPLANLGNIYKTNTGHLKDQTKELEKQQEIIEKIGRDATKFGPALLGRELADKTGRLREGFQANFRGGPADEITEVSVAISGWISDTEKIHSIFQSAISDLDKYFGLKLPSSLQLFLDAVMNIIQGLQGGGSGLFGLFGNLLSLLPGGGIMGFLGGVLSSGGSGHGGRAPNAPRPPRVGHSIAPIFLNIPPISKSGLYKYTKDGLELVRERG